MLVLICSDAPTDIAKHMHLDATSMFDKLQRDCKLY